NLWFGNPVVFQQNAGLTRVFAGDQIHHLQRFHRAVAHIAQVSYWGCDQVEHHEPPCASSASKRARELVVWVNRTPRMPKLSAVRIFSGRSSTKMQRSGRVLRRKAASK